MDPGGTVEILAQQGYSSIPCPPGWDGGQPPAGWPGWSKSQVPVPLRPDQQADNAGSPPEATVSHLESQQPIPQMATMLAGAHPGEMVRTEQHGASPQQQATAGAGNLGPYVQVTVTPLAPGERSQVNIN